jgi:hypothetical protein
MRDLLRCAVALWLCLAALCAARGEEELRAPETATHPSDEAPAELLPPPLESAPEDGFAELAGPPAWLPEYHLDVLLETKDRWAKVQQTVRWTNPASVPTDRLVFHVYPRHKPDAKLLTTYQRTLESFRVDPREAIDAVGRRVHITSICSGDAPLKFHYHSKTDTLLIVQLPALVLPGETVEVTLEYTLDIPPVQGRFGQYRGVTNLLNWYPILAYYDEHGWDDAPYIAWHQPWLNEAGNYTVRLTAPCGEKICTGGEVLSRRVDDHGYQHLLISGFGLRDFAVVASPRFEVLQTEACGVKVQVYAFPEHRHYAELSLKTAVDSLALFSEWFGPYPHAEFKVAESYFGWNGNESSGMILVDERVFDAPKLAHLYIDHLVSHEICHQWWYSTVGTDGFRQTWMDEGLVCYLTEYRVKLKHGPNPPVFDWPKALRWLPNIRYQTLQHNGYYLYRGRGGEGHTVSPLPEMEHVHNLFFLVYDRGNKVTAMIHQRLGTERFFEFLRLVYCKYQYRILRVEDFQCELEAFTGESWEAFFGDWLYSPEVTDWKIDGVWVEPQKRGYQTTVKVRQREQIAEPVEIGWTFHDHAGAEGRVLLEPEAGDYTVGEASVARTGHDEWTVTFTSDCRPKQIHIDPDYWVLDADLHNNRWRQTPAVRLTPFYTPLDETQLMQPLDRLGIAAGPGIDVLGRPVVRGSIMKLHEFRVSPFMAYTPRAHDNQLTAGVDAVVWNLPAPNWSVGAVYEHTLASDLVNDPNDQGRLYLRWDQIYTTSFLYPNLKYWELFVRFGDNFYPFEATAPSQDPAIENYRDIRAAGVSFHADSRMPYWNPDTGFAFDATYEYGFPAFGEGETFHRGWAQASAVRRLPGELGPFLSETKLAGRLAGGLAGPDNGQHFRLGGPDRLRGLKREDVKGNAFWVASAEWRVPLRKDMDIPLYDNVAQLRSVYGSIFYDVGEAFLLDDPLGVEHAVGAGLYFDLPLFSLIENFTLRVEYAHALQRNTDALWGGWYFAF